MESLRDLYFGRGIGGYTNPQRGSFLSLDASRHTVPRGVIFTSLLPILSMRPASSQSLNLEVLARHFRWLETVVEVEPLASLLEPNGKCNHKTLYAEGLASAKDYTETTAFSGYHSCGMCAMMIKERGGIVSECLLVYGLKDIRIVGFSITPTKAADTKQGRR